MPGRDEELLRARLRDVIAAGRKRPSFLGFLDEAQVGLCEDLLRREEGVLFWGGYPDAERKLLGVFPEFLTPEPEAFPLSALTFSYRETDALSHRDFLGSLMALGVERDAVGDILVGKGRTVVFVRAELEAYFLQNIVKIGRTGVQVASGIRGELPLDREFETLRGVVASPRLDCAVAFVCRLSREKAAGLIQAGMVLHNHREALSGAKHVEEGDVLSIRKKGKFVIDRLGPPTSKGRLAITCRKYK